MGARGRAGSGLTVGGNIGSRGLGVDHHSVTRYPHRPRLYRTKRRGSGDGALLSETKQSHTCLCGPAGRPVPEPSAAKESTDRQDPEPLGSGTMSRKGIARWLVGAMFLVVAAIQPHSQQPGGDPVDFASSELDDAIQAAWVSAASAAILALLTFGGAIGALIVRPFKKINDRLDKLEKKLCDVALDVERIKRDIPHFDKRLSELEKRQWWLERPTKEVAVGT